MSYCPLNLKKNYNQDSLLPRPYILKKEHKTVKNEIENNPVIWTRFASPENGVICPLVYTLPPH
jgi:hypothetical protein